MPTSPPERMVSLEASFGPIMVELVILLVILLPNTDAPDADMLLPYPTATPKNCPSKLTVLLIPSALFQLEETHHHARLF